MPRAALLALAGLVVTLGVAAAGEPRPEAPVFEHVHALSFDAAGRTFWLGAHTGLYRSENGGRTWMKVELPARGHGPDVMAIAPHPAEVDVLYVGAHEAGVVKTTDGGKTWTSANAGLRGLDIHGLAIDSNAPTKLHALVRETGAGVYRTTDGGQKWVRVDDGPSGSWSREEVERAMRRRRLVVAAGVLLPAVAVVALLAYGFTREPRPAPRGKVKKHHDSWRLGVRDSGPLDRGRR